MMVSVGAWIEMVGKLTLPEVKVLFVVQLKVRSIVLSVSQAISRSFTQYVRQSVDRSVDRSVT